MIRSLRSPLKDLTKYLTKVKSGDLSILHDKNFIPRCKLSIQYVYYYYSLFLRKFHDPRAGVLVLERGRLSYIVNMHYFFKNLLLYSQA